MTGPTEAQHDMNTTAKMMVMANTLAICIERMPTEVEQRAVVAASDETDRAVYGNRTRGYMTWHDCRLVLAAHLRYCLRMLENKGA